MTVSTSYDSAEASDSAALDRGEARLDDPRHDQPAFEGSANPYVVATTQRSGSTLLCHLLAATGRMGVPAEYFRRAGLVPAPAIRFGTVAPDGALAVPAYIRALLRRRTTPNGVFAMKLHFHQVEAHLAEASFRTLLGGAAHVWLRRRDLVAQAISFAIARRTGAFQRAADEGDVAADAPFDLQEALAALASISRQDNYWRIYFEANAIVPLEIWYEDVLADPDPICRRIAGVLGIALAETVSLDRAPIRRQRTSVNAEWRDRLMEALRFRRPAGAPSSRNPGG